MPSDNLNNLQADKIHLLRMEILKCHIDSPFEISIENIKEYEFKREFNLSFNIEDKLIKADFKLEVISKSEGDNNEEASGLFDFAFVYKVENLEYLSNQDKKNHMELSRLLANAIASITYSTTRGILFTRLKGTSLEGFILPVIDPNSLLEIDKKKGKQV